MINHRIATLGEVQMMLDWAAEEGWNPGLGDAAAFYAADPDGFFVGLQDGEPVASISVVNHNSRFAFLGLYIVRPAFRGQGLGFGLWRHALRHAGTRTIGLDGVPEQQANYAASGFVHAGSTTRFTGKCVGKADPRIKLAVPEGISELVSLEATQSKQAKPSYLSNWFQSSGARKTMILSHNNQIAGFCTARECREGTKIGPLYAVQGTDAEALIRHVAAFWAGPLIIDAPTSAVPLIAVLQKLGFTPGFQTARMYRGPIEAGTSTLFAVTSLELG